MPGAGRIEEPRGARGASPHELGRNVVILACAVSAGIHGAVVPDHLAEGAGAGLGFAAATVLLATLAVALTRSPAGAFPPAAAAAVLAGLLATYVLAVTTGLPVVHPQPEQANALALATKAVELAGLLVALGLLRRGRPAAAHPFPQPKGTPT
jgi:hypothetical protein